jgi:CRP/FNR family transcriptional regulator
MTLSERATLHANSLTRTTPVATRTPGAFLTRLATLAEADATTLRLRQNQQIPLAPAQDDRVFAIRSGVIAAIAETAGNSPGVISLYFPGDVIKFGAIPCFSDCALIAGSNADALRLRWTTLSGLLARDQELFAAYDRLRDRQMARAAIHATVVATLDGPQRLAAFLIEMALEVGIAYGDAVAIDLPLTRTQIAQYLALNPDTLSRLMSRFKADGLIWQKSRHQISLRNLPAVSAMCPVTAALLAIERNRPSPMLVPQP